MTRGRVLPGWFDKMKVLKKIQNDMGIVVLCSYQAVSDGQTLKSCSFCQYTSGQYISGQYISGQYTSGQYISGYYSISVVSTVRPITWEW